MMPDESVAGRQRNRRDVTNRATWTPLPDVSLRADGTREHDVICRRSAVGARKRRGLGKEAHLRQHGWPRRNFALAASNSHRLCCHQSDQQGPEPVNTPGAQARREVNI